MGKAETAGLLRDLGYTYLEIAAELYPEEFEEYVRTRDRKLYARLKKRVGRLLEYFRSKECGPSQLKNVGPPIMWAPEFDDSGGEREPLDHRASEPLCHPGTRKAGKSGIERQVVEYEQLLYHYYKMLMERYDPSGTLWATARLIHGRAFREYYERYRAKVWSIKSARATARTYAYTVLTVSALFHGLYHLRFELEKRLNPDRDLIAHILPITIKHVI